MKLKFCFLSLLLLVNTMLFAQVDTATEFEPYRPRPFFKLNAIMPGLGIEYPLSNRSTIDAVVYAGRIRWWINRQPVAQEVNTNIKIAWRRYYNLQKREEKGKYTDRFSGAYIAATAYHGYYNKYNTVETAIGPVIGLQRNHKIFHFGLEAGLLMSLIHRPFVGFADLQLGFVF